MNRQTLMDCAQIGSPRIDVAKENLIKLNPDMELELYNERLEPENIRSLIKDADIAVSARPNFPERLTLNEACVKKGIPMIEAAMDDMSGYLFTVNPGESACLACLVENDNPEGWKELGFGVLGAVSGTIGCLAAVEAVKVLTGYGEPLGSRMYHLDMLTMRSITPELKRNPHCRVCGNK
jgi:molybdopterin/thiamine biosynthesis adenylyltransferase